MGWNVPTFTANDFSFGPAVVFLGATGATPTTDVGAINADDGVTVEIEVERNHIMQGNPKMSVLPFDSQHGFRATFNSIEWDVIKLAQVLGSGVTSSTGSVDTWSWGGDPTPTQYALQIRHDMAQSGHTIFWDVWTAVGDGGLSIAHNQDAHQFDHKWRALRSTTNWASAALARDSELFRWRRLTA